MPKTSAMFSVRQMPWHGVGVVLDRQPESIEEALEAAGLDWQLIQRPGAAIMNIEEIAAADDPADIPYLIEPSEGFFMNLRSDTNRTLGVVTRRYSPVQNVEAFAFLSNIFGSELHFETAGELMGGRRVWVMMKVPDFIEVGGDQIGQYAFIHSSHDGKHSVTAGMTPIRMVSGCTVTAAVRDARDYDADRVYSLMHVGDVADRMHEADRVLQVAINYFGQFKDLGDRLAQKNVGHTGRRRYVELLIPIREGMGDRAVRQREEARQEILSIHAGNGSAGDTSGNSPGTWWCLYNAAVEWADYYRRERKEGGRFQRMLDDPDGFKTMAFEIALAMTGL